MQQKFHFYWQKNTQCKLYNVILRALLPLVVGVAQGQSIYTAHIKQKSMQCQWWDGMSGEGGSGVNGCKGREPQNFSSVFIPPWTVQVMEWSSMQLVELHQLNDGKDHLFMEQWATESMEGRICLVWGSDVYIQTVPRANTSSERAQFGRAQCAAFLGEGTRNQFCFFSPFLPCGNDRGTASRSPHMWAWTQTLRGKPPAPWRFFPCPSGQHTFGPIAECRARRHSLPGIVPLSFPCLGLLFCFRAARGGIPKAAAESS